MAESSITRITGVSLDQFASAILSGQDDPFTIHLKDQVAAHLQGNARIQKILKVYNVSLRKERGMSSVLTLLIQEILSCFSSDFAFLPLGNTPLKGARTLRKPDAVLVPPHVAKRFRALRDSLYTKQAKEDADEMRYWQSLVNSESEMTSPISINHAVPSADSVGLSDALEADCDGAETVKQAILLAERQNAGKVRQPDDDAGLKISAGVTKQSDAILWSQVAVAFELKRSGSRIPSKKGTDNLELDTYSPTTTGSRKRKVDTPGSAPSSKKAHVTLNDVQLVRYMTEMRSALGHRTHTFGCLLRGRNFMIKYSDPYGLIESEAVDFTKPDGLKKMATVIVALACAKRESLGFDARFKPPKHSAPLANHDLPASLTGWRYRLEEDTFVTIRELIHVQWCQTGRGTSVYLVDHDGDTRVLKTSYPHASRPREATLLQTARERLEARTPGSGTGVTRVYSSVQGDSVSQGFRTLLSTQYVQEYDRRLEILLVEKLEPLHYVKTSEYIGPFNEILQSTPSAPLASWLSLR